MPVKTILSDLKNVKSSPRRSTTKAFTSCCKAPFQQSAVADVFEASCNGATEVAHQSCWVNLPPELLRNVLQRIESAEGLWPARKDVVACSAVCRTWRETVKDLVRNPEESGKLTFPISLKQPGPRNKPMQCFIKRDKGSSTYYLYLGLSPSNLLAGNSKFLLAARRSRRLTSTEYIISLNADDMSRKSSTSVGILRSNFLATKFTVYEKSFPETCCSVPLSRSCWCLGSQQVSPKFFSENNVVAHIGYELNVLGTRGPRRMNCVMHTIPTSVMEEGAGGNGNYKEFPRSMDDSFSSINSFKALSSTSLDHDSKVMVPLVLKNKSPRWHEQLQCWCLNFRGRVTVASVKNFQLVASLEPNSSSPSISQTEQDKVLLQFGKIGKDIFTMDYRYPLSAFQAFSICLTSFGTKLACE